MACLSRDEPNCSAAPKASLISAAPMPPLARMPEINAMPAEIGSATASAVHPSMNQTVHAARRRSFMSNLSGGSIGKRHAERASGAQQWHGGDALTRSQHVDQLALHDTESNCAAFLDSSDVADHRT